MAEFEIKILVHEKLSIVWETFMDETKKKEWVSGLKKVIQTSGRRAAKGSRYELTFDEKGKDFVVKQEIQEVIKNKRLAFTTDHELIKGYFETNFHARGYSTEIVAYANIEGKGFKGKTMVALAKGKMRKRQEKDLNSLKTLIEGQSSSSKSLKK